MAIFLLDTWTPLKDKRKENDEVVEKILRFGEKHPKISKHVKSLRYFKQGIGKPSGRRVLIRVREPYRNGQIVLEKNRAEAFTTYQAFTLPKKVT